jgi:predicted MarR family transcription regulator
MPKKAPFPSRCASTCRPAGWLPSPIVSSAHLVSPQSAELSEFEFGLIVAGNAFHRWITHCMSAAGLKDLTPLDVLVLHHVTHRARDKRLADICFIMNVEDTHLINYSLKKLQNLGVVVAGSKNGKEVTYASTELGRGYVQRYREIREACLINALKADDGLNRDIGELGAPVARAVRHVRPGRARGGIVVSSGVLRGGPPSCTEFGVENRHHPSVFRSL